MVKLRLRTKFLLSMLLISAGLTCTSLLLVRRSVQHHVKSEISADLQNSVSTFQNFQRERELTLSHSAGLLADLPNLRALMTTHDQATIQDASTPLWQLAGSDLFVLADSKGRVMALQTASPGFTREMAQESLAASLTDQAQNDPGRERWWFGAQHLYQVFLKPVYFGPASDNRLLGLLIIGYEIDDSVANQVSRISASHVAFYYGDTIVRSTLTPLHQAELAQQSSLPSPPGIPSAQETNLGDEHFLGTSLELADGGPISVRLTVLKSYDQATAFLDNLNHLLLALGLAAVIGGSGLVFLISHTFTRPLGNLVAGVRALERGDFHYALDPHGGDEVAEVTGAFNRMRAGILKTQQQLLEAERLATIGRMASSVSHDLRHSLAAIVANAEFLCESRLSGQEREELYQEVREAVNRMTDLIDSLLEFSRTRESLRPAYGSVRNSVDRAIQTIKAHPDFSQIQIRVSEHGNSAGWFDQKKLERAISNLLMNACESVSRPGGAVAVRIDQAVSEVEIRVSDNGRGIPESIQNSLFEPFVSCGKENGTGLGLTVVQKIIQDHGGDVMVECTSNQGTVFKVSLPLPAMERRTGRTGGTVPAPPISPI